MRRVALVLLPIGPMCVGLLRFLLPYYTADGNLATARAVAAHPGRESAVLWLGLAAMVTLVPGVIAVAAALPASRLKAWALGLSIPGYLCLGVVLAEDYLLWSGTHANADPHSVAALLNASHASADVGVAIFVVGHVVGTVLLGLALLRSGIIPAWAAWAVAISQPLHFVAAVVVGSPQLDLAAWSLTAVGMAFVARTLLAVPEVRRPTPVLV
jgi:hypothetical protein